MAAATAGTNDAALLAPLDLPAGASVAVASVLPVVVNDVDAASTSAPEFKVGRPRQRTRAQAKQMVAKLNQALAAMPGAATVGILAMNSMYQGILDRHNFYRQRHQAGNLVWDDRLASQAEQYAARCVFAHDRNANAGENLYAVSTTNNAAGALINAIDAW